MLKTKPKFERYRFIPFSLNRQGYYHQQELWEFQRFICKKNRCFPKSFYPSFSTSAPWYQYPDDYEEDLFQLYKRRFDPVDEAGPSSSKGNVDTEMMQDSQDPWQLESQFMESLMVQQQLMPQQPVQQPNQEGSMELIPQTGPNLYPYDFWALSTYQDQNESQENRPSPEWSPRRTSHSDECPTCMNLSDSEEPIIKVGW